MTTRVRFPKRHSMVFDTEDDLETYFLLNEFKTRNTHTTKPTKCTIIHDLTYPTHDQVIRYKVCVSNKCHEENSEEPCPMKKKIVYCDYEKKFYMYENDSLKHINKYPNAVDVYHGIHPFYIREIDRMYRENIRTPLQLYTALKNNLSNRVNGYDSRIPMPSPDQISNYLKRYKEKLKETNEEIAEVVAFVNQNLYVVGIDQEKPIFFGIKMGDGSDSNHLYIGITTVSLLKNIYKLSADYEYMFHLDTTYKLTKNGFSFIVFGFSDKSGHFFAIAFMLISHEESSDFEWFYKSLKDLYKQVLDVNFKPKYIMQDASRAEANAATTVFGDVKIIMCYFHVLLNCKKRENLCDDWLGKVKKDIKKLFLSTSKVEFDKFKEEIYNAWIDKDMIEFIDYFDKQWVTGYFNTWPSFNTPIGYAGTNNSCESMNSKIKDFTKHDTFSILT